MATLRHPHWTGVRVSAWRFGGADQVSERCCRPAPQLTPQQERDQPAPPPGREMEVSIEPDQRSAFFGLGQRHAFVIFDAEREMHEKVDPMLLRIGVNDFEQDRPLATEGWRSELDGLARPRRPGRVCRDECRVQPLAKSVRGRQDFPHTAGRSERDRRWTNIDDHAAYAT